MSLAAHLSTPLLHLLYAFNVNGIIVHSFDLYLPEDVEHVLLNQYQRLRMTGKLIFRKIRRPN